VTIEFAAEINISDPTGECVVAFDARATNADCRGRIENVLDVFIRCTAAGMFSLDSGNRRTPLESLPREPSDGPTSIGATWRLSGTQRGAFRLLLNMLSATHRATGCIAAVTMTSPPTDHARIGLRDVLNAPFPQRPADLPFSFVAHVDLQEAREPVIRCEFARAVEEHELARLVLLFQLWDSLTLHESYGIVEGGSDNADQDVEEIILSQPAYLAAPETFEHVFYEFSAPAAAFDALLNMAIRVHHLLCPLVSLQIE
jgi:hypothetical protein